jgi:hypothetical protein
LLTQERLYIQMDYLDSNGLIGSEMFHFGCNKRVGDGGGMKLNVTRYDHFVM